MEFQGQKASNDDEDMVVEETICESPNSPTVTSGN